MLLRAFVMLTASMLAASSIAPPSVITESRVQPKYSDEAREAKISGRVVLDIAINADGLPVDATVVKPLGYGLDEEAKQAVLQWRFRPATKEGKPIPIHATVEVVFRLTNSPAPDRHQ